LLVSPSLLFPPVKGGRKKKGEGEKLGERYEMRIVSGKYRGTGLLYPKKNGERPTQDRVKEAVFSAIHEHIDSALFLDLFACTGSIGLEALSRGAEKVVFVDINVDYVKKNLDKIKLDIKSNSDQVQIFRQSFLRYIKMCGLKFNIIYLDPPWTKLEYFNDALKAICEFDILAKAGLIICEHPKKFSIEELAPYKKQAEYRYGDTSITMLKL
jgi:16S rRNA (guanine966-N2)-methyltransferase